MTDFDPLAFAQQLATDSPNTPAPVSQWDPPFCGDIDLEIRKDGLWYYCGTPIGRPTLVRLFARVLKREGDDYFLVTPVEKVGIRVEDVPFMITSVQQRQEEGQLVYWMETSLGDHFRLDQTHPLRMGGTDELPIPYVMVRAGMEGRLSRPVFYELAAGAFVEATEDGEVYCVESAGERFVIGKG